MVEHGDFEARRHAMVEKQIAARGVRSPRVLEAMRKVKREGFLPSYLGEFAYEDAPLPIEEEQTISQPYIVAFMVEALQLEPGDRVLEIGTGSGYAAAVLAEVAGQVFTIERHEKLAELARERLRRNGYEQVQVRQGDGTLGWPEEAPFDAIIVAAGGPDVPQTLKEQLAIGGRLVIPVGETVGAQHLVRVTRKAQDIYEQEELAQVRFVPLVGEEGWHEKPAPREETPTVKTLKETVAEAARPLEDERELDRWLTRVGDARVVLLGEASHGTSEFYSTRAAMTKRLIEEKGYRIVCGEADWPDAAQVDHYVRDLDKPAAQWQAFARFPTWMWRNEEFRDFVEWLRDYNSTRPMEDRVRFAGLDLYSLFTSIDAVLGYLDAEQPEVAQLARTRYGCLTPFQGDPAAYGKAAVTRAYQTCEAEVVKILQDLLRQRMDNLRASSESWFDAVQNARLVADAERYYRVMYYGSHESWNLRDQHMFETLTHLLEHVGPDSKAVVWEHNSHIGNAKATEMSARGEWNIGQLSREAWGDRAYTVGFGTDSGTVAAASYWDGPLEIKQVQPSHPQSYEFVCHETGIKAFCLPLRHGDPERLIKQLTEPRLERAIGVIYRPETELASHYFQAILPQQFDEYVWFDRTQAVTPLETTELEGMPETWPFGI